MMAKSSGMGGISSMPPSRTSSKGMTGEPDGDEEDDSDQKSAKMMALNELLDSIGQIASDDLKPHIQEMQRNLHMSSESPDTGHEEPDGDEDSGLPPPPAKGAIDISVGMGAKPPMGEKMGGAPSGDDEDEEEGLPKGGFLAILAKKMKKK
jgi:hypothetical protein